MPGPTNPHSHPGLFAQADAEEPVLLNPEVGTQVGPFFLTKELGAGAMATVFAAADTRTGAPIAVKVLRAELCSNLDAMRRFDKEALVAQKVQHPNLVSITDVLHPEGFPPVLVMELLEGTDVARAVKERGPFPPEEAIDIAMQIAGALQALHNQSIVHRDLKSENVFLGRDADGYPVAKLLDFGLVRFLYGGDPFLKTRADANLGTPAFMAPEQFGNSAVDNLADIYALGVILYEMLTGDTPFPGASFTELARRAPSEDPPPPSKRRPTTAPGPVPPALDAIVLGCLARKRDQRIRSAAQVYRLLTTAGDPAAKVALPSSGLGGIPGWAIGLGVAIAIGIAGWFLFLR
jgi:serine/threonine-protein kinase